MNYLLSSNWRLMIDEFKANIKKSNGFADGRIFFVSSSQARGFIPKLMLIHKNIFIRSLDWVLRDLPSIVNFIFLLISPNTKDSALLLSLQLLIKKIIISTSSDNVALAGNLFIRLKINSMCEAFCKYLQIVSREMNGKRLHEDTTYMASDT